MFASFSKTVRPRKSLCICKWSLFWIKKSMCVRLKKSVLKLLNRTVYVRPYVHLFVPACNTHVCLWTRNPPYPPTDFLPIQLQQSLSCVREKCVVDNADGWYTGCPRTNVPDFGRVFLTLKYTDITQNTYVQSWTVTEIMAWEKCGLLAGPRTVPVSWQVLSMFVLECGVLWRKVRSH